MIGLSLQGGLGNQMFQCAAGMHLANLRGTTLKLYDDLLKEQAQSGNATAREFALHIFGLNVEIGPNPYRKQGRISRLTDKLNKVDRHYEKSMEFDASLFEVSKNALIHGYFQSEKYFFDSRISIQKAFKFPELSGSSRDFDKQINKANSVSVHIRRGDYVNLESANETHGTLSLDYYKNAMSYFDESHVFFIFSDDIEWCQTQFGEVENIIYVMNSNETRPYEDMCLMSRCKHNIIANSSYSWWGAWLNQHKTNIVIAPKNWFKKENLNQLTTDLIPISWKRI